MKIKQGKEIVMVIAATAHMRVGNVAIFYVDGVAVGRFESEQPFEVLS